MQSKPEPARFIPARISASGWLRRSFAAPGEERAFGDALCRLGQTATLLHDDDVERLVHIDSDLIAPVRPSSCPQVPSCEDNSVIADVQGTARTAIIRHLEARGQLSDLSTVQLEQLQNGRRCDPLGAIHPTCAGGEYLPVSEG